MTLRKIIFQESPSPYLTIFTLLCHMILWNVQRNDERFIIALHIDTKESFLQSGLVRVSYAGYNPRFVFFFIIIWFHENLFKSLYSESTTSPFNSSGFPGRSGMAEMSFSSTFQKMFIDVPLFT